MATIQRVVIAKLPEANVGCRSALFCQKRNVSTATAGSERRRKYHS